jgi:hypothetical protein
MIRVYDGPGPDAHLVYEGPDGEPFQIEFQPGQLEPGTPLFLACSDGVRRLPLNDSAVDAIDKEETAPETPHEELLQRIERRLDGIGNYRDYVDWAGDVFDGSLDRVVRAVLAEVRPDLLPPD